MRMWGRSGTGSKWHAVFEPRHRNATWTLSVCSRVNIRVSTTRTEQPDRARCCKHCLKVIEYVEAIEEATKTEEGR